MERREALKNIFNLSIAAAVAPLPSFANLSLGEGNLLKQNAQSFINQSRFTGFCWIKAKYTAADPND